MLPAQDCKKRISTCQRGRTTTTITPGKCGSVPAAHSVDTMCFSMSWSYGSATRKQISYFAAGSSCIGGATDTFSIKTASARG